MSAADEKPFLDAIFARYPDDGPRLVYADWLGENGSPLDAARAELIRVQVALARLPDDHRRRSELANRQTDLLQRHRPAWTAPLADLDIGIVYRRGIPDAVSIDAADFLDRGGELFKRLAVRRLRLERAAPMMPRLIHCPFLAEADELDLSANELGNGGVNLFVRSPHLAAVRSLDLGFNSLDDAGVRVLARSSALAGLRELALNDNGHVTGEGVRAVAESPFFAGLTALDLSGNDVNDAGVQAVIQSRGLAGLRSLKLAQNHIGDAGIAALARSPLLAHLLDHSPRLELWANAIGFVGARALAGSDLLARVAHLDLSKNYLGDHGATAIADSGRLANLRTLKLAQNQITDAGAWAVAAAALEVPHLRLLDLSGNRLGRRGVAALAAAATARGFALDVSGNATAAPPVAMADVVPGVLTDLVGDEVAALRRRVSNPARPTG